MIYLMSDTHGDIARLRTGAVRRLHKGDTLIVLGDFGFIWDGSKKEKQVLQWLAHRRYQLLFLDGSHENFDLLEKYPHVPFAGDIAQQLGPRMYRLERGAVYTLEGHSVFTFGGGESIDRESRQEKVSWWRQELPTQEDFQRADASLAKLDNRVDAILTHDGPTRLISFLQLNRDSVLYEENALEKYLDGVMHRAKYGRWCFGRYHLDQPMGGSAAAVYRKLIPLFPKDKGAKPVSKSGKSPAKG